MGRGQHHGLMDYAQGIEIFSQYLQRQNWNEDCIKERGQELFRYSVQNVWNLGIFKPRASFTGAKFGGGGKARPKAGESGADFLCC